MSLHALGLLPESVRPTTNGYLVTARATAPAATLAPPRAIDGEAVVRLLAAAGVRHVRLEFADLHGIARSKLLPLARFGKVVEEGTAFYGGMLHSDARGDDLGPAAYPDGPPTLPDYLLTPDLTTLAVLHPTTRRCRAPSKRRSTPWRRTNRCATSCHRRWSSSS